MTNDENVSAWSRKFAQRALKRASVEFRKFEFPGDLTLRKSQLLAEAALEVGILILDEVARLQNQATVEASRNRIVAGLADTMKNGCTERPSLPHSIVTAIATARDDYDGPGIT